MFLTLAECSITVNRPHRLGEAVNCPEVNLLVLINTEGNPFMVRTCFSPGIIKDKRWGRKGQKKPQKGICLKAGYIAPKACKYCCWHANKAGSFLMTVTFKKAEVQ